MYNFDDTGVGKGGGENRADNRTLEDKNVKRKYREIC